MKKLIVIILFFSSHTYLLAQEKVKKSITPSPSFHIKTKIISFGLGFPNLHRTSYDEPKGYTHLKTTGFGPFIAKFEYGISNQLGLVASYGYGTFHYSYYGLAYYPPPTPPQQVIFSDDVNVMNVSISCNYHFSKWVTNPKLDVYAGGGIGLNYFQYRYGNIPPYKPKESKVSLVPVGRIGVRYYLDNTLGVFTECGYDGISVIQLGFSVRF